MREYRQKKLTVTYQTKVNEAIFKGKPETTYEALNVSFCCAKMRKNWSESNEDAKSVFFSEGTINIITAGDYTPYEGYNGERIKITHCPWCGRGFRLIHQRIVRIVFDSDSPERLPMTVQGKDYMVLNYERATKQIVEELTTSM